MNDSYVGFAEVYDELMDNVPYEEWAEFLTGVLSECVCVVCVCGECVCVWCMVSVCGVCVCVSVCVCVVRDRRAHV